jgi:mannose-1-phosphate guanylyltransferase
MSAFSSAAVTAGEPLEAILLVGGKGTRLRPLTLSVPKPLLPTAGVPFLAHQLARAAACGVTRVVLATSYRSEMFAECFGDGSAFGLEMDYIHEAEPLGTGGGIRNAAARLRSAPDDPVVVLNGDVLSGHDLRAQLDLHRKADAAVTLHLVEVDDPARFGCVPTDDDGRVTAFLEKTPNPVTNQINAGCYVYTRRAIDEIPPGQVVSVERETFPALIESGQTVMGYVDTSYWLDVGTPETFVRGACDLVLGRLPAPALANLRRQAPPRQPTTSDTAPREAVTGEAASRDTAPREAVTGEAASREAVTGEAATGEAVSREGVAREAVSREAATGEAVSREAVSREAVSREAVSREAVSREAASREAASGEAIAREAASREGTTGEAALLLPGAVVHETATVDGGTTVGAGAVVGPGATVTGSVLFDGATIAARAQIRNSVIGHNAKIDSDTVLDGVVIGDNVKIAAGNELRHGARVWPGVDLPPLSIRFSTDA